VRIVIVIQTPFAFKGEALYLHAIVVTIAPYQHGMIVPVDFHNDVIMDDVGSGIVVTVALDSHSVLPPKNIVFPAARHCKHDSIYFEFCQALLVITN
jgi:hypothetical protein